MFEIKMGLPKPEKQPDSFEAMRRDIESGQRDSGLILNCLAQARHQGMSGEDTYTLLAYHALRMLEDIWQQHMKLVNCMPAPPIIMPAETVGEKHG